MPKTTPASEGLFIGLMSGTSMDGADAVLVRFAPEFELLASTSVAMPEPLHESCLDLCEPGHNEIDRAGEVDKALGHWFAEAAREVLSKAHIDPSEVCAIGSHGQTIRHRPGEGGFSLQLGSPDVIATRTGITTVANFRNRDMVLGGQGAPLVPAFHAAHFGKPGLRQAVVNIGGMANLTLLDGNAVVGGFDTGPGNVLLDLWHEKHQGEGPDMNGYWAASGNVDEGLLATMLADPYFRQSPPKSTGREYFNSDWLTLQVGHQSPRDVQATLSQLTAASIAEALVDFAPQRLLVCGGGAHNGDMMQRLQLCLGKIPCESTLEEGLNPDWVEACAFAWLARARLLGEPGNAPAVTGASDAAVLGAVYSA